MIRFQRDGQAIVKYFIKTKEGKMLLLRISDIEQYETKKKEYEIVEKYSKLGFLMSQPIDFGICNNGKNVYMLLTWIEGKDLEEVLSDLTEEQQYQLGRQAGKILKKIHSIDVDINDIQKIQRNRRSCSNYHVMKSHTFVLMVMKLQLNM